jgi:hypothetical protein
VNRLHLVVLLISICSIVSCLLVGINWTYPVLDRTYSVLDHTYLEFTGHIRPEAEHIWFP